MSLRNDVTFVTGLIVSAIRQVLGETLRALADYLLKESTAAAEPPPEPVRTEEAQPRHRRPTKVSATRVPIIHEDPPPDVLVKPTKPRDRSGYNPKDHGPYKIAAIGILTTLFEELSPKLSVPALAKILTTSTDSSIRTACKTMVKDGILSAEYESGVRSDVYWISDPSRARAHLSELEASAPTLPMSE